MLGTRPGHAARQDLTLLREVATQPRDLFVVDEVDVLQAETADLSDGGDRNQAWLSNLERNVVGIDVAAGR
jgi:hypothetical protein